MTITRGLPSQSFRFFLFSIIVLFMIYGTGGAQAATITVPAGGDFQAALNAAQGGDTIILEAGASYIGPFTLPAKPSSNTDYITIQSSALSSLPSSSQRVSPQHASLMPKLLSPGNNQPALMTAPFSHHYRLVGIELAPRDASAYVREIIRLGDGSLSQNSLSMVPHHIILDRCYIHAHPTQDTIRGVALNSAETTITNCYISEFHSKGFDSQAVWGWNGPGPFHIINNYLEASGENLGFGGADPGILNMIPSDIEIRHNTLSRPLSWRGQWMVKNLFELKVGQRVVVEGNIMENNWADAQAGYAIQLTVRNQDGASRWNAIRDVVIRNNIIRHVGGGINMLGRDDNYASEQMSGVRIENNLFEDVSGARWGGNGNFIQMTTTAGVVVDHNTVIHTGSIINAYPATNNPGQSAGFVMKNNIVLHNEYGIFGGGQSPGMASINVYFPGSVFQRNVMAGAEAVRYPLDNYYPGKVEDVQFVNSAGGDYRLAPSSAYKLAATDGKDLGCDFGALYAALPAGEPNPAPPASPTPTPSPTPSPSPSPSPAPSPSPSPSPSPLVSPQLVSKALNRATTLAAAMNTTVAEISPLVTEIEQCYSAFLNEAGRFGSSSGEIDRGLRASLYFARAAMALAEKQSNGGVQNRLQTVAYRLEQAKNLITPNNTTTASIQTAHASGLNPTLIIGNADTRSGASFAPLLAPGSIGVILGDPTQSPLAVQTSTAEPSANGSLPYMLAGVSVTFGGQAAALLSVSASRITFLVPAGQTDSSQAEVIVTLEEGYVSRGTASVMKVAPALFTVDGTGAGAALALNATSLTPGTFNVTTEQNLSTDKRTRLIIYTTGLNSGAANSQSTNDVSAKGGVIANFCESVAVEARTRDGHVYQLPIEFAGAIGSVAGLEQINIILIPELSGAGTVDLTLIVGGQRSNGATISVQ